ncbi:MAG: AAA family ATPase [Tenericutes bacterium]|nr:AAA family ATPase [Mycoplasmatota bacterium]
MDKNLPILLLKKLSILPTAEVRLELNNELSQKIIEVGLNKFDKKVVVILPKETKEESLGVSDLPNVGVLCLIKSSIILPNKNYRVVLKGLNRVKINNYSNYRYNKSILVGNVKMIYIDNGESVESIALKKKLISLLKKYIASSNEVSNSVLSKIKEKLTLDELTDIIVNFLKFPIDKKIAYMNEFNEVERAKMLIKDISIELEILSLDHKIDNEIRDSLEKEQKEFLIKNKIDKLNEELGVKNSKDNEISDYLAKINNLDVSEEIRNKLLTELKKYEYTPVNNPEISVIRTYLDTLINLPFNKSSEEESNLKKISEYLDKTHFKMDEVKNRIKEYAYFKEKNPNLENPIICLVGSPGVGKSTIASSIAGALKRKFYKISVGGLNDSSELIGHRRTYLGASPGKIMEAIIKCNTNNPVILIDEVDKIVKDYKGDPSSTLLDILDSNLNKNFTDNYIEESFDLSKVLFILTANDVNSINPVLRDRLEIIYIDNYTSFDKKDIAIKYLLPKICQKYSIKKINITEEEIVELINNYTIEPGIRELERLLDKIIRYMLINGIKKEPNFNVILGLPIKSNKEEELVIGQSNIIGVSPYNGATVKISSIYSKDMILTGNIGNNLKNSILMVLSYLRNKKYINEDDYFHINFNVNKYTLDGYSGGLGVAASIISLVSNKRIDKNICFIGAIDLYGRVLKVSRLRDKIITCYNNNLNIIYLPIQNKIDEEYIPEEVLQKVKLRYISTFDEVYNELFK